MTAVPRSTPADARQKVQGGMALLVCAYASEELCRRNRLEGSLSLAEFTVRLPSLDRDQEIIFYCA